MKTALLLFAIVFLVACSAQLKVPTSHDAERGYVRWGNYDSLQLASGFSIYKNNCGRCHNLHLPKEFSEEQWNNIIPKMTFKAKLDSSQTELVHRYILVMASDTSGKK
jgi:hypothetical protein